MTFRPAPEDKLTIGDRTYRIAEHPAAPGMAYGQSGRRGTVYQLMDEGGQAWALKVFLPQFREPRLVGEAERIRKYTELPGLRVAERDVLTSSQHITLIREHMELAYAVLMPWIPGRTWFEVVVNNIPISSDESLRIAHSVVHTLLGMEERGLAHCDLSGSNVILKPDSTIELVDLEEMYASDLSRPVALPGGSPGYAHKTAPEGLWQPEADRFAGAVLLAEILGWSDERICKSAWGEGYFDPCEMQTNCERFNLLRNVLREDWNEMAATFFERAWFSETLALCPTFTEWLAALPEAVPERVVEEEPSSEGQEETIARFEGEYEENFVMTETPAEEIDSSEWLEVSLEEPQTLIEEVSSEWICSECGKDVGGEFEVCPYCEEGIRPEYFAHGAVIRSEEIQIAKSFLKQQVPRWTLVGILIIITGILGFGGGSFLEYSEDLDESLASATMAPMATMTQGTPFKITNTVPPIVIQTATTIPIELQTITPIITPSLLIITEENIQYLKQIAELGQGWDVILSHEYIFFISQNQSTHSYEIYIWMRDQAELISTIDYPTNCGHNQKVFTNGILLGIPCKDGSIYVWDIQSGESIITLESDLDQKEKLEFSRDGELLVARNAISGLITVWNVKFGEQLFSINDYIGVNSDFYFSKDGSALTTYARNARGDYTIRIWNTKDGEQVDALEGHSDRLLDIAISPLDEFIASGSADRTVRIWKFTDGELLDIFEGYDSWISDLRFSHDSDVLLTLTEGNQIYLWSMLTGELISSFYLGADSYSSVESPNFSYDGSLIFVWIYDWDWIGEESYKSYSVQMWSVDESELLFTIDDMKNYWFSPEGNLLVTESINGIVSIWGIFDM
jgi:WD40 repeat protein/rubrerythrin